MFDPVIEVLVLAAVALIVLSRLYMALGRGGHAVREQCGGTR